MAEKIVNLAQTTLKSEISAEATSLEVTSATGFPGSGNFRIVVGDQALGPVEIMLVTAVAGAKFTVTRAAEEPTAAAKHLAGTPIVAVLTVGAVTKFVEEATPASVTTEKSRAEAAEAVLEGEIDTEEEARSAADTLKAPLVSPALTGTPTAPTAAESDNSTKLSTTAYADRAATEAEEDVAALVTAEEVRAKAAEALKQTLANLSQSTVGGSETNYPSEKAVGAAITAAVQGLSVKASVLRASTAVLPTVVYANGAEGVGATLTGVAFGELELDGAPIVVGKRYLIKNQVAEAQNGIYTATAVGGVASVYVLTRATDMNQSAEFPGAFVFVEAGTVNEDSGWTIAGSGTITVGTTAVKWTQFSGAGEITVEAPIEKTGNKLSLSSSVVSGSPTGGVPAWAKEVNYVVNQLVGSGGVTYICKTAHKSAATFAADESNWAVFGGSGNVKSVAGKEGEVTLEAGDVVNSEDIANKTQDSTLGGDAPSEVLYPTEFAVQKAIDLRSNKSAVKVATKEALPTNVYANGTAGVGATLTATAKAELKVDGETLVVGDRVLIKNEAEEKKNGIYVVTTVGSGSAFYVLTRAHDMNTTGEFRGASVLVEIGPTNGSTLWINASNTTVTVGTTAITFTQFISQLAEPKTAAAEHFTRLPPRIVMPMGSSPLFIGVAGIPGEKTLTIVRCIVPITGLLKDIAVYIKTSSGEICPAVYDTGQAKAEVFTRLDALTKIASPGTGWQIIGNPSLAVVAGQQIGLGVWTENGTIELGKPYAGLGTAAGELPPGFIPTSGLLKPKLWVAKTGVTTPPAEITEAEAARSSHPYSVIARIE